MKAKGYVYILTNKAFKNLVKIGFAKDVEKRITQMNSHTEVPYPFEIYSIFPTYQKDADKKIHTIIDTINPDLRTVEIIDGKERKREFFEMTPEQAATIISSVVNARMAPRDSMSVNLDKPRRLCENAYKKCAEIDEKHKLNHKEILGLL